MWTNTILEVYNVIKRTEGFIFKISKYKIYYSIKYGTTYMTITNCSDYLKYKKIYRLLYKI